MHQQQQCRICAKESLNCGDALKLFERRHRKLLTQLKEITGLLLKNSVGLPKLICSACHTSLQEAYQFRENVLKVQASFKIRISKGNNKFRDKGAIEATEFVQVCYVKEENDTLNSDVGIAEEKEINFIESGVTYKKEEKRCDGYTTEINALELSPNEENTVEDTKITLQEEKIDYANDLNCFKTSHEDEKEYLSGVSTGRSEINQSDAEYNPNPVSPKKVKMKKDRRRQNLIRTRLQSDSVEARPDEVILKGKKNRKRRKDAEDNSNLFICDQCGNHFTCRHHFKLHLRRHTGDKQCACELCPDKFFTSSELRRHMRKHTGERPFACKFCERRFTDYSTRIKHERTHTNERPFMCSQCGKSFTTSYILKNHMLTHTGERHFKCDVCNKAFTRRTHLVVHFRSIMHKQAVEKEQEIIPQEIHQPQRVISAADIPTFLV